MALRSMTGIFVRERIGTSGHRDIGDCTWGRRGMNNRDWSDAATRQRILMNEQGTFYNFLNKADMSSAVCSGATTLLEVEAIASLLFRHKQKSGDEIFIFLTMAVWVVTL